MYKKITDKKDLVEYLDSRLNLPTHILHHLADDVLKSSPESVYYIKKDNRIWMRYSDNRNAWGNSVQYWLETNYSQCACCGEWFTENLTPDIFGTSFITLYSYNFGYDVDFYICGPCTLERDRVVIILSDCMEAFDTYRVDFLTAFYPVTHNR
jgi:hypothetical protein